MTTKLAAISGTPQADRLLSKPEAAAHLSVSARMMERLVAERRVPVVRIGRHIRLRASDLDAFIVANTSAVAA